MKFISKKDDIATIEVSVKEAARLAQLLSWVSHHHKSMYDASISLSIDEIEQVIKDWRGLIHQNILTDYSRIIIHD